jgi:hypothetical protein
MQATSIDVRRVRQVRCWGKALQSKEFRMNRYIIAVVVACAVAGGVAVLRAQTQQPTFQTSPIPLPASDTLKVMGGVEVTNVPTVLAQQLGPWTVTMETPVAVSVADTVATAHRVPAFLAAGERYAIAWPTGKTDTVQVVQARADGWVQVDPQTNAAAGGRWINPSMAMQIEWLKEKK